MFWPFISKNEPETVPDTVDLTCDAETVAVSTAEKKKPSIILSTTTGLFHRKKKENNNTSVWKNASQGFPPTLCLKNTNETIVIIVITSRDAISHMLITGLLRIPVKTNVTSHPPGLKYIAAVSNHLFAPPPLPLSTPTEADSCPAPAAVWTQTPGGT